MKKNIEILGKFLLLLFSGMMLYLGYICLYQGPQLQVDRHNPRLYTAEKPIWRGTIFDRRGRVLAEDRMVGGVKRRVYPAGEVTAHPLGYVSPRYGRNGLEAVWDRYLLALDDQGRWHNKLAAFLGRPQRGYQVYSTIDLDLQRKAARLLGQRRGAVVAIDPLTGRILAMVSSPSFDPVHLEQYFQPATGSSSQARLVNRAVASLYPPGSTFKIVTAAAALQKQPQLWGEEFFCRGSLNAGGYLLKEQKSHGRLDFAGALAVSCNVVWARLGMQTGYADLKRTAVALGWQEFNYRTPLAERLVQLPDLSYLPGVLPEKVDAAELAASSIGQGRVLASPLQMAVLAGVVAARGRLYQPHFLAAVTDQKGKIIVHEEIKELGRPLTEDIAGRLALAMQQVVQSGTGKKARLPGMEIAGKTGTAENGQGLPHAWFVGFAPVQRPQIALAVLVENGGGGGEVAAPLAAQLFASFLANGGEGS
ncbi:MAG: peptidoglycan D,D-transpeptidase FtsI family protein [Desulfurispora sp.]|uniref:peptidoglycan D,D-transpeptidase FtsI family protein n=1 Tax=Desulfurispora sp. TaxID=3014275 RepID=UPI0040499A8D